MTEKEIICNRILKLIQQEDLTPKELNKYRKLRDKLENDSLFAIYIIKYTDYLPEHHKLYLVD